MKVPLLFLLLLLLLLLLPLLLRDNKLLGKSFFSSLLLLLLFPFHVKILFFGFFFFFSVYLLEVLWLKHRRIRWKLRSQGITGPPPSFLYGNLRHMHKIQSSASAAAAKTINHGGEFIAHDYTSTLFPYFEQWRKEYGTVYTYSTGNKQHLYVNHPELVREMNQIITLDLGKPSYITRKLAPMLGNGILRSNGRVWAQQRKIVAPEFFMDKVKGMAGLMLESAEPLVKKWEAAIEAQGGLSAAAAADIRVEEDLRSVSADVISRACFGSSSYFKGKQIFAKLRTLQKTMSNQSMLFGVPTFGFLPTRKQKEIRILEREIESLIWEVIEERKRDCLEEAWTATATTEEEEKDNNSNNNNKDLLQLILEGAVNDHRVDKASSKRFIVDNCKNIYFAGHESTAVAASWCLMLLALHPEWQSRILKEIDAKAMLVDLPGSLLKMQTVTMVIQETLRLYPPAAFVSREALEDTQIGHVMVPKGVCTWTLIPTLHRDPEIWGPDANEFRPERFANGVSNACKVPQAYVPFGLGPRLCVGRNFAMVELKILISIIVSKFDFCLSPKYRHSPAYRMIVEPGNGVHILVQRRKQD